MSRCGCDDVGLVGCQCIVDDSDCIEVAGTGISADPYIFSPVLDPDPDNLLACSVNGLTAMLPSSLVDPPRARVGLDSDFAIPISTLTAIDWNLPYYNVGAVWSAANPSRFTAPVDGDYLAGWMIGWNKDASGTQRRVDMLHTDISGPTTTRIGRRHAAKPPNTQHFALMPFPWRMRRMNAGDYIEAHGFQNGNSSVGIAGGEAEHLSVMYFQLVAAL